MLCRKAVFHCRLGVAERKSLHTLWVLRNPFSCVHIVWGPLLLKSVRNLRREVLKKAFKKVVTKYSVSSSIPDQTELSVPLQSPSPVSWRWLRPAAANRRSDSVTAYRQIVTGELPLLDMFSLKVCLKLVSLLSGESGFLVNQTFILSSWPPLYQGKHGQKLV